MRKLLTLACLVAFMAGCKSTNQAVGADTKVPHYSVSFKPPPAIMKGGITAILHYERAPRVARLAVALDRHCSLRVPRVNRGGPKTKLRDHVTRLPLGPVALRSLGAHTTGTYTLCIYVNGKRVAEGRFHMGRH